MKTVRSKILVPVLLVVSISLVLLGAVSIYLNIASTNSTLKQTMTEMAVISAERVSQELNYYKSIAAETGSTMELADPVVPLAEKKAIIDQKLDTYGLSNGDVIQPDGIGMFTGNDYSDRDYFSRVMQGEVVVTDPIIAKTTGELSVVVAAPLWEKGIPDTRVLGVVFFIPKETILNDIVSSIHISTNGSAYMVNSEGVKIAHKNIELVKSADNDIENAKTNPKLKDLGAFTGEMAAGNAGFGTYTYDGMEKFLGYAPVMGSAGWSLAINAPVNDFMAEVYQSIVVTIILLLLSLVIAVLLMVRLANRITRPIRQVQAAATLLAQGELDIHLDCRQQDEIGQMAQSFREAAAMMGSCIRDLNRCLTAMSVGDFRVSPEVAYLGEFATIEHSLRTIIQALTATLREIIIASDQVSAGSDQVSNGAQALAQGATEQASAVQELAATINEIASSAQQNAAAAQTAREKSRQAGTQVDESAASMNQMVEAMAHISSSSEEIAKIINTIENIAFQTNILALNAAVEAARAGVAGKGFAVVADEVRNLASKSDQAAKATKELIENSVSAVKNGDLIVENVSKALKKTAELTEDVVGGIEKIAAEVELEAQSISQVTEGVEQISAVVQTNSATSEESAAASEELSAQAQMLKQQAGQFHLPEER